MSEGSSKQMSKCTNQKWSRKSSPTRGQYLKLDDELMNINRGGRSMSMIKNTAFGVPPIVIGHLDQEGVDILDEMIRNSTNKEIVEFFKHYVSKRKDSLSLPNLSIRTSLVENVTSDDSMNKVEATAETKKPKENQSFDLSRGMKIQFPVEINEVEEHEEDEIICEDGIGNSIIPIIEITTVDNKPDMKKVEEKKGRSVFDILDADYLAKMIPYMHPDSKICTFGFFFDRVHEVCDGNGLTEKEVVDVIQFRMGGSYLVELKQLRSQGKNLKFIEQYFLEKDIELDNGKKRKEKLMEENNECENMEVFRDAKKKPWGLDLSYCKSAESGLRLILSDVVKESPAWRHGLRAGDTIIAVNGWMITLMDKPEVALHLFQASSNHVVLGVLRSMNDGGGSWIASI